MKRKSILTLISLFLAACNSSQPTTMIDGTSPISTAVITPSSTTNTIEMTPLLSPTMQQTPTSESTPMLTGDPNVISRENITRLEKVHRLGRGFARDALWSGDGKTFLVASNDGMYIFNGMSFEELQFIELSLDYWDVAISYQGDLVAMAMDYPSQFDNVLVWDTHSGELKYTLKGHDGKALSVAFDTSGERLASGGMDRKVRVWDLSTGDQVFSFDADPYGGYPEISDVAFNPSGTILASTGLGTVTLYDLNNGELLRVISGHEAPVERIKFNSNGSLIVSGGSDNFVLISNVETGQEVGRITGLDLYKSYGGIASLDISPNDRLIATGSCVGYLRSEDRCTEGRTELWDMETGNRVMELETRPEEVISVSFRPDGKMLATIAIFDGAGVKMWDPTSAELLHSMDEFNSAVGEIAFSPDSKSLASIHKGGLIHVWDTEDASLVTTLQAGGVNIRSLHFSPDGSLLAAGGEDRILIWDTLSWNERLSLQVNDSVGSVRFSPDGTRLAWNESIPDREWLDDPELQKGPFIRILDVSTGEEIQTIEGALTDTLVFIDDTTIAASGGMWAKVWDLTQGIPIHELKLNETTYDMDYNPYNGTLAIGKSAASKWEQTIWMWNPTSTKPYFMVEGNRGMSRTLDFSPDGEILVSGGGSYWQDDHSIMFFEGMTGDLVHQIDFGTRGIRCLRFSPDGEMIGVANLDGTLGIWRVSPS
jgi:WD40 repeat protein